MKEKKQVCWERFPFIGAVFLVPMDCLRAGMQEVWARHGLGCPQVLKAVGVDQITEERVQGEMRAWVLPLPIPGDSDIYTQASESEASQTVSPIWWLPGPTVRSSQSKPEASFSDEISTLQAGGLGSWKLFRTSSHRGVSPVS